MMPPREPISEIDALIRQAAAADPFDDIETLMAIEASIETAKTTATAAATTTPPTVAAAPGTCCICLDKPPTHLFAPCLHKCICDGCARRASEALASQIHAYQLFNSLAKGKVSIVVVAAVAATPLDVVADRAHLFETPPLHSGGALEKALGEPLVLQIRRK
jgi:hypothetical protein